MELESIEVNNLSIILYSVDLYIYYFNITFAPLNSR